MVKNPPVVRETWVLLPEWEEPLEKGTTTTPVFWSGEFRGQYSPCTGEESGKPLQYSSLENPVNT